MRNARSSHLAYINRDDVIVSPGRYTGAGNTGLFTVGKFSSLISAPTRLA